MFRFRLQKILRLRERERDDCRRSHAELSARLEAAEIQLQQLRALRARLALGSEEGELTTALALSARLRSVQLAAAREQALQEELRRLESAWNASSQRLLEAHRKVEGLLRLRERRRRIWQDEMRAKEFREMDDLPRRSPEN